MQKRNGFTLLELIVGMSVFLLLIGGIVGLFTTGIQSFLTGKEQAGTYAEARAVMNDLKTTLRYADENSINLINGELSYSGSMVLGTETNKKPTSFSRKVTWVDDSHQQLNIAKVDDGKTTEFQFPTNPKNNAFSEAQYLKVYEELLGTTPDAKPFPIFQDTEDGVYDIVLPIKHRVTNNANKVEVLRTKVNIKDNEEKNADTAVVLSKVLNAVLKNDVSIMQNGEGKFLTQVTSGGQYVNTGAGATKKLIAYAEEYFGQETVNALQQRSWVIAACDASGNPVTTNVANVAKWKLYVAKNVVDDKPVDLGSGAQPLNAQGTAGQNEIKRLAETGQRYVIRVNYGFMVTRYEWERSTGTIIGLGKDGFSVGQNTDGARVISSTKWVSGYKYLTDYSSSLIEDTINSVGVITKTGKRARVDYDGAGQEYTLRTVGTGYSYPPNMPTKS